MKRYNGNFYLGQQDRSLRSGKEVVPLVIEMVRPGSVLDLGCGTGSWLSLFRQAGIEDIYGADGEWVNREMLRIPPDRFLGADLSKPLRLNRTFDLVMSLEVAEHLPPESSGTFVDSLVAHGPVILFSAAIPGQGGTNHVNEQWPDYWASMFRERGYVVLDAIRKKIWQNEKVDWWYAQNMLLFARGDRLEQYPLLKSEFDRAAGLPLSVVHPKQLLASRSPENRGFRDILADLTAIIRKRILSIEPMRFFREKTGSRR
jgi:SAM-dependent methyltransferase